MKYSRGNTDGAGSRRQIAGTGGLKNDFPARDRAGRVSKFDGAGEPGKTYKKLVTGRARRVLHITRGGIRAASKIIAPHVSGFKREKEINKTKAMYNMVSFVNITIVYFFFGTPELVTIVLISNGSLLFSSIFAFGIVIMFFQCFVALTSLTVYLAILRAFVAFRYSGMTDIDE